MSHVCQPAPRELRSPRYGLPAGTTDSHVHVFGPVGDYPYIPARDFTPPDALPETAERVLADAGVGRVVLIQPTVYGKDNRRHLSAAKQMSLPARVVIAADPDCPERSIADFHEQGARGMRLVLANQDTAAANELAQLAKRLSDHGWHIQLLARPEQISELEELLSGLACPLVIDHLGLIDPNGGIAQPAFQALRRLLAGGNCRLKLSGYYRLSRQGPPYDDMAEIVRALVKAAPERVLWGSDWPHPAFSGPMPDLTDLIDPLVDWIPDEIVRKQILVDNPADFYRFDDDRSGKGFKP